MRRRFREVREIPAEEIRRREDERRFYDSLVTLNKLANDAWNETIIENKKLNGIDGIDPDKLIEPVCA